MRPPRRRSHSLAASRLARLTVIMPRRRCRVEIHAPAPSQGATSNWYLVRRGSRGAVAPHHCHQTSPSHPKSTTELRFPTPTYAKYSTRTRKQGSRVLQAGWPVYQHRLQGSRVWGGGRALPKEPTQPAQYFATAWRLRCSGIVLKCGVLWRLRRAERAAGLVSVVYIKQNSANQRRNLALTLARGGEEDNNTRTTARRGIGVGGGESKAVRTGCRLINRRLLAGLSTSSHPQLM